MPSLSNCLIIFGRYPIPGRVKTRLISCLGPVGAAQLQKDLTEDILKKARSISYMTDLIFFFEGGSKYLMKRWLGKDIYYSPQHGTDLGERMQQAILYAQKKGYEKIVLIGTDIPKIAPDQIKEAFFLLDKYDVVIGPSEDGGYWLIGMKRLHNIFEGVDWGTNKVFFQTMRLVKKHRLSIYLLDELVDIDDPDDMEKTGISTCFPYVSVIIPTLNEQDNIKKTIEMARSPDAEIIIVDGGSQDKTKEIVVKEGVKLVEWKRGRAFQQNKGAEMAKGKVLLFLHADTRLPKGYSCYVFHAFMDPACVLGAFRFKTDMRHPLMRIIESVANIRARYFGLPYGDQALFIKKSTFETIGGFPIIPGAEDLHLVKRISKMGKIKIVPVDAITSSRKWKNYGIIKTTYLHWKILLEFYWKRFKRKGLL